MHRCSDFHVNGALQIFYDDDDMMIGPIRSLMLRLDEAVFSSVYCVASLLAAAAAAVGQ